MIIAFNKPFQVLSQFTDRSDPQRRTLSEFGFPKEVYAAGRLDYDSEGLLLLTDDGRLAARLTQPRSKLPKTYWVQVEGTPSHAQMAQLRKGVLLSDGPTLPVEAKQRQAPVVWPRDRPIRYRKSVPDAWLELTLREGRNRQVRRMTALVGLPTLRLIRVTIVPYALQSLLPGQWRVVPNEEHPRYTPRTG